MDQHTITITGIESKQFDGAMKYVLKTNKGNYNFYDNKKDGGITKAWTQFQALKLGIGDTITVGVKEEQKSYEGKPYTDRKIMFFTDAPQNAQNAPQATIEPKTSFTLEMRLDALEARVAFLENPPQNNSNDEVYADIDGQQERVPF